MICYENSINHLTMQEKIDHLRHLRDTLNGESLEQKIQIIDQLYDVKSNTTLHLNDYSKEHQWLLKQLLALGQGPILFSENDTTLSLDELIASLIPVEKFYRYVGGIIGYHLSVLELLQGNGHLQKCCYHQPPLEDISSETSTVQRYVKVAIENIANFAEIFPVGGAGERLNLTDPNTGEGVPVACLRFGGRTLLEGLMRDVQAWEYLHYKLCQKKVTIPIAMMTSYEKNNHKRIIKICEENNWFGRPEESFYFFTQPMVPVITREGDWVLSESHQLAMKPGGHGVIWKLAKDQGVFDWLKSKQRKELVIRQINNPIAGIDYGLLAFAGKGHEENKKFGFASCPRVVNSSEGMNVLIEKEVEGTIQYCISNIEYTDLKRLNIEDTPHKDGSPYSKYPSNTNILFANLHAVEDAVELCPIPGKTLNMKTPYNYTNYEGKTVQTICGRLESTMQNIADVIVDPSLENLSTFLTYNRRDKTISVTKKAFQEGSSTVETPEGCFQDLMEGYKELLTHYCGMDVDEAMIDFHPALGPMFSIIAQKIRGGVLHNGSELRLEIAELDMEDVDIDGSLIVIAENGLNNPDEEGGRCTLKNVIIKNRGIDPTAQNTYWNHDIQHHEVLRIHLHGHSEFLAENITLAGDLEIDVPNGIRIVATEENGELLLQKETINKDSWYWNYAFDDSDQIVLKPLIAP